MTYILLSMLSVKSVDVALKRLLLSKDSLRGFYGSSFISSELRNLMMKYVNGETSRQTTRYDLNELRESIIENNGHNGNNGRTTKKDKDSLESPAYIR